MLQFLAPGVRWNPRDDTITVEVEDWLKSKGTPVSSLSVKVAAQAFEEIASLFGRAVVVAHWRGAPFEPDLQEVYLA